MNSSSFRLISDFNLMTYRCGVKAGSVLRLRQDIAVKDHNGIPTGKILPAGGVWKVLPGSKDDVGTVRLMQPDGKLHTWDDAPTLLEAFEVLSDSDSNPA